MSLYYTLILSLSRLPTVAIRVLGFVAVIAAIALFEYAVIHVAALKFQPQLVLYFASSVMLLTMTAKLMSMKHL
jgi:hypothetical protein